ncbi:MAG: amidase, partial [Pseudomonadota bacterium]
MRDATALAADIAAGRRASVDYMQAALEAADRLADYGATARIEPEIGLKAAEAADKLPKEKRGPFHGVPFLGKDLGAYSRGLMPGGGNPSLRKLLADPEEDDALFERFRTAGLVPFGLTTVPECGLALTSEPPGQAPARNPFDKTLTPGGSSGGAGAAVAAGIVAIAHATDAAGSIRVPAACCGLVGLKPSRDRVPGGPHFNNHLLGIANEATLSRSVRDGAVIFDAIKLDEGRSSAPMKTLGLVLPDSASAATANKVSELVKALETAGFRVKEIAVPENFGQRAIDVAATFIKAAVASGLAIAGMSDEDLNPISAAVAAKGRAMPAADMLERYTDLLRLSDESQSLFETVDALVMPVLADGPPVIGTFDPNETDPETVFVKMNAIAPNAALANVSGLPALAMPFGMMP